MHKIAFPLTKDADDYPPFDVEDVWAFDTGVPSQYIVDNIPFFARAATCGDVVIAKDLDGRLVFQSVVTRSPRSLVRVAVFDMAAFDAIRTHLKELGCTSESFTQHSLLAVDIPLEVDLETVRGYLSQLRQDGTADYEVPISRHPS